MRLWFSLWLTTTAILLAACNGGGGGNGEQRATLYYEGTPQEAQNPRLPDSLKPDTPPTQQTDYRYVIGSDTVLYEAVISNSQDTSGSNTIKVWVTDSGKTAFLLSPQASQITRLPIQQLSQRLRAQNPLPSFPYEPTDSSAEVAGYDAQHYRMDTSLSQHSISFKADLWTTEEVGVETPAWMTEFSAFELVQGQPLFYPNVSGVPVKFTMNIAGKNPQSGKAQTNKVQFELTKAETGQVPDGAFQLPDMPVKDLPQQQQQRRRQPPPQGRGQQGQQPQRQQPQRQQPQRQQPQRQQQQQPPPPPAQ